MIKESIMSHLGPTRLHYNADTKGFDIEKGSSKEPYCYYKRKKFLGIKFILKKKHPEFNNLKFFYIDDISNLYGHHLKSLLMLPNGIHLYIPYVKENFKNEISEICFKRDIHIHTLDDIGSTFSKYIPKDNAILFLDDEDCEKYKHALFSNLTWNQLKNVDTGSIETKLMFQPKLTIFLQSLTHEILQKADSIAKELKQKYKVQEVNVFGVHCFEKDLGIKTIISIKVNELWVFDRNNVRNIKYRNLDKIITTNSTAICKPEKKDGIEVIDSFEIFKDSYGHYLESTYPEIDHPLKP